MSIIQLNDPPIQCYTVSATGKITGLRYAKYGFIGVSRTDTMRRRKPSGINLFKQATAASTVIQRRKDSPLCYYIGGSTTFTTVCEKLSNGYNGEKMPDASDLVRNKLLSKARNDAVNLANALGEYKQCANMFVDGAKSFVGLVTALHSRNPRVIKRYLFSGSTRGFGKIVSKRILEFQYGVKPLISDINDSIDALKRRSEARPVFVKVSAAATKRDRYVYPATVVPFPKDPEAVITDLETQCKGWAVVTLNNSVLNQTLGQFGFTNPLAVAYELTAFSFVLDWWFNVGEFIASLDNCLYFKDGFYQLSHRDTYERVVRVGGVTSKYTQLSLNRDTVRGLGSVASLHYKPSTSRSHVLNGLALITQALANLRR